MDADVASQSSAPVSFTPSTSSTSLTSELILPVSPACEHDSEDEDLDGGTGTTQAEYAPADGATPASALRSPSRADDADRLALCPARFILGGGVMEQAHLFDKIRRKLAQRLAGYVSLPNLKEFIIPPMLGAQAGILGAMALAQDLISTIPNNS